MAPSLWVYVCGSCAPWVPVRALPPPDSLPRLVRGFKSLENHGFFKNRVWMLFLESKHENQKHAPRWLSANPQHEALAMTGKGGS